MGWGKSFKEKQKKGPVFFLARYIGQKAEKWLEG